METVNERSGNSIIDARQLTACLRRFPARILLFCHSHETCPRPDRGIGIYLFFVIASLLKVSDAISYCILYLTRTSHFASFFVFYLFLTIYPILDTVSPHHSSLYLRLASPFFLLLNLKKQQQHLLLCYCWGIKNWTYPSPIFTPYIVVVVFFILLLLGVKI